MDEIKADKRAIAELLVEHLCSSGSYTTDSTLAKNAVERLAKMSERGLRELATLADVDITSDIELIITDPKWWDSAWVLDNGEVEFTDTVNEYANHPRVRAWMDSIPERHRKKVAAKKAESTIEYIITDPEWWDWVLLNRISKKVTFDPRVLANANHPRVQAWMKRVKEVEAPKLFRRGAA